MVSASTALWVIIFSIGIFILIAIIITIMMRRKLKKGDGEISLRETKMESEGRSKRSDDQDVAKKQKHLGISSLDDLDRIKMKIREKSGVYNNRVFRERGLY